MAVDGLSACGVAHALPDTVQVFTMQGSTEQNLNSSKYQFHSSPVAEAILNAAPEGFAPALGASAAYYPLSSVPTLNSLPGAKATLYLDFDGHYESRWGQFINLSTPAYDTDNNTNQFSDGELSSIQQIWAQVAEDYAPFDINVTTVAPAAFGNGQALRVSIGGSGSWLGSTAGGIGYIDAFTNSIVNTAYVFAKNLGGGNAKYVAEATSHEAGHSFGLDHQSQYTSSGVKLKDYYAGPGDGRAPVMGDSYTATRGLWWYGTPGATASRYQDDMTVIARAANGFGYRGDDVGNSVAAASALSSAAGQISASGVITYTTDTDYYAFSTSGGQVSLSVTVPQGINNLDARLELRDATGSVIISESPAGSFGASITTTLSSGTYFAVVASQGGYGDVGQYQLSGSIATGVTPPVQPPVEPPIVPLPTVPAAPGSIAGNILSTAQVSVSWADVADETGYKIERSANNGVWTQIAVADTDVTSYVDETVAPATTYQYRVRAYNTVGDSLYSGIATVVTADMDTAPIAPTNLTGAVASTRRLNLSWRDNSNNETGFIVQRSYDARSWQTIGQVGANVTGFSDVTVNPRRLFYYRVVAVNAVGYSAASNTIYASTSPFGGFSSFGGFGFARIDAAGPATVERNDPTAQPAGESNITVSELPRPTPHTDQQSLSTARTPMFRAALDLLMSNDDWLPTVRRGF